MQRLNFYFPEDFPQTFIFKWARKVYKFAKKLYKKDTGISWEYYIEEKE